jgi:ATP-dependent Clp protease ATP-binding subunit ClpA
MNTRFDRDARRAVLRAAQEEARALGSATVEAEHLLLALASDERGGTGRLLAEVGLDHDGVNTALQRETERSLAAVGVALGDFALPEPPTRAPRSPKLAASAKRVLECAACLALARKDRRIGAPHLLVGILRAEIGTVPRALAASEVDRIALLTRAERLLG